MPPRGHWPPDVAPPVVPPLKETVNNEKVLSVRERMEQHRSSPACSGCHKIMDPIGLSLENFDAIGRLRTEEEGSPIDASGMLVDGTRMNGVADLRKALLTYSDQFVRNITERLLTYAVGRGVEYYDMPTVRSIVRDAAGNNYRFSSLILGIVKSEAFRMNMKIRV